MDREGLMCGVSPLLNDNRHDLAVNDATTYVQMNHHIIEAYYHHHLHPVNAVALFIGNSNGNEDVYHYLLHLMQAGFQWPFLGVPILHLYYGPHRIFDHNDFRVIEGFVQLSFGPYT